MSQQRDDSGLHPSEFPTSAGAAPNQVVLGGNELRKRVGQGGMGEVWLAFDVKLHRHVALKTMRPDWAKNAESATRFYTEARSVAKLNHPNIVQIYQIGEDKGLLFFTMEWVDGKSLEAHLKEKGELSVSEALDITLQILDGLAFANQQQVIHRDVKP
ncbi:protein kinase, partial [bacterium]|nr:protein kinase [bacterium]